jgi:hypothetical protein
MKFKFIGSFSASAFKKYDQNREIFFLSQKRRKFSQSEKKINENSNFREFGEISLTTLVST